MPVTASLPRAAVAILLALGLVWAASRGSYTGATRKGLVQLTGTQTRSALRRAIALAREAGLVRIRALPDGRAAYVLTRQGASALASLGVSP